MYKSGPGNSALGKRAELETALWGKRVELETALFEKRAVSEIERRKNASDYIYGKRRCGKNQYGGGYGL